MLFVRLFVKINVKKIAFGNKEDTTDKKMGVSVLLAHLSTKLMMSYCGQSMSVVRRASCVVRRAASTIALKAYSSYTPGSIDSILGRKHQGDL